MRLKAKEAVSVGGGGRVGGWKCHQVSSMAGRWERLSEDVHRRKGWDFSSQHGPSSSQVMALPTGQVSSPPVLFNNSHCPIDQNVKKEEIMDEVCVKEEKYFPKEELMDDTKVKEEPQINPPVGSKRKLAMSR